MFQKPATGGAPVSPFAHLASRLNLTGTTAAAKKAEDDEKDKKDAKNEDDERGDEDDKEKKEAAKKKAKEEKEEEDAKKAKEAADKKKAADDEKDKDEKDDEKNSKARAAERSRIKLIVDSLEAAESDDALHLALDLALNTDQDTSICLVNLRAFNRAVRKAPKAEISGAARDQLRERMAVSPKPDIGVDGDGGREPTLAEKIIMAGKKRRGEI
jgi:hypothetical protein